MTNLERVTHFLQSLQNTLCDELASLDGEAEFSVDAWDRKGGGGGRSRILSDGDVFERAGVGYSHVHGDTMPDSATKSRPELAGKPFQAVGVSLVLHPRNPYVPTTHANFRFFSAGETNPVWWFGGGYDLTPYYPFREDVEHWHRTAKAACDEFGEARYPHYKKWCDDYFYLRHRDETRGVGGVFFDDLHDAGFETEFGFWQTIANSFLPAYTPIVRQRQAHPFAEVQRDFQLYRRGRYVEFNLLYDRGTLFGLQSGGRTESILMSLPPEVRWKYNWAPTPGSPEEELYQTYLKPQDWLHLD